MKRRGKCRCGAILHFPLTSQGYKTKCPQCGAVVRLRVEATEQVAKSRKSPSAVLAAVGPPPVPEPEPTDFDASNLSLDESDPLDFSELRTNASTAPKALTELEAFDEKPRKTSILPWLVFGALALLVGVGVGVAAMVWG